MRFMTQALLVAVILITPALSRSQENDDAPALTGTWKIRSLMVGGKKQEPPEEVISKMRFVFAGKSLTIKGGPSGEVESTFAVDDTKKPAHLTVQPPKGEKNELKAIYKIENDRLTICGTETGARPTEFASKEGTDIGLMILERVKE